MTARDKRFKASGVVGCSMNNSNNKREKLPTLINNHKFHISQLHRKYRACLRMLDIWSMMLMLLELIMHFSIFRGDVMMTVIIRYVIAARCGSQQSSSSYRHKAAVMLKPFNCHLSQSSREMKD